MPQTTDRTEQSSASFKSQAITLLAWAAGMGATTGLIEGLRQVFEEFLGPQERRGLEVVLLGPFALAMECTIGFSGGALVGVLLGAAPAWALARFATASRDRDATTKRWRRSYMVAFALPPLLALFVHSWVEEPLFRLGLIPRRTSGIALHGQTREVRAPTAPARASCEREPMAAAVRHASGVQAAALASRTGSN